MSTVKNGRSPEQWTRVGTGIDPGVEVPMVDRQANGRVMVLALLRKLARRLFRREEGIEPSISYGDLIVFDRWSDRAGWGPYHEQDLWRILGQFAPVHCDVLFEAFAGPAYIGFSLLARGFCNRLILADANPRALEAARRTAQENSVEHLVRIYHSDVLDRIPSEERWDLVVGVPPSECFKGNAADLNMICHDPNWSVHRRFYASVKRFIKPGGRVILVESRLESSAALFQPMVEAAGGHVVGAPVRVSLSGKESEVYYLVTEW